MVLSDCQSQVARHSKGDEECAKKQKCVILKFEEISKINLFTSDVYSIFIPNLVGSAIRHKRIRAKT